MEIPVGKAIVRIILGDITEQETDAIVNAANTSLMGGGGVDGAIHSRGGPRILEDCKRIRREKWPEGLPPGKAVATTGGRLPARYVFHTVGPVWMGGNRNEGRVLRQCYLNSLLLAENLRIRSISFPSISTGAYGYPIREAAGIAMQSVKEHLEMGESKLEEVRFILFGQDDMSVYATLAAQIFPA